MVFNKVHLSVLLNSLVVFKKGVRLASLPF